MQRYEFDFRAFSHARFPREHSAVSSPLYFPKRRRKIFQARRYHRIPARLYRCRSFEFSNMLIRTEINADKTAGTFIAIVRASDRQESRQEGRLRGFAVRIQRGLSRACTRSLAQLARSLRFRCVSAAYLAMCAYRQIRRRDACFADVGLLARHQEYEFPDVARGSLKFSGRDHSSTYDRRDNLAERIR